MGRGVRALSRTDYEFLRRRAWGSAFDRRVEPLGRGPIASIWVAGAWLAVYAGFVLGFDGDNQSCSGIVLPLLLMWPAIAICRRAGGTETGSRGQATWDRDQSSSMEGEEQTPLNRMAQAALGARELQLLVLVLPLCALMAWTYWDWDATRAARRARRAWTDPALWAAAMLCLVRAFAVFRAAFAPTVRVTYLESRYRVGSPITLRFGIGAGGAMPERVDLQLCCVEESAWPAWGSFRRELGTSTRQLPVDANLPEPGSDIDVTFAPILDCPGTKLESATPTYWELRVKAHAGISMTRAIFMLPVYGAAARSEPAGEAGEAGEDEQHDSESAAAADVEAVEAVEASDAEARDDA